MQKFMTWGAALSLALLQAPVASAALVTVDDGTDLMTATVTPTFPTQTIDVTQEGVGVLGDASIHFEYLSADTSIPGPGATQTFNVNFFEPRAGATVPDPAVDVLSDTLSVTLTGHVVPGVSNVSVDTSFLAIRSTRSRPPLSGPAA